jgi:hypothetical protein
MTKHDRHLFSHSERLQYKKNIKQIFFGPFVNSKPSAMAITIAESNPNINPLDGFKNIIADKVSAISGADPTLIYKSLEAPRSPDHGDFAIAVPKLRVKGNPAALAKDWAGKVGIKKSFILGSSSPSS